RIDAGQAFDRLGVHWIAQRGAEETVFVEIRTSADGASWSDWRAANEEEDMTNEHTNEHLPAPMPLDGARSAEYPAWRTADAAPARASYYHPAVTRGWGDIGYNYLVDK